MRQRRGNANRPAGETSDCGEIGEGRFIAADKQDPGRATDVADGSRGVKAGDKPRRSEGAELDKDMNKRHGAGEGLQRSDEIFSNDSDDNAKRD
jgi:hypothetical protein